MTEEEKEQWRRARDGNLEVRNQLIVKNMRLAYMVAREYAHDAQDLEDVAQLCMVGLIQAANRYDPDKGGAFSAFAIRGMRMLLGRELHKLRTSIACNHATYRKAVRGEYTSELTKARYEVLSNSVLNLDEPLAESDGSSHLDMLEDTWSTEERALGNVCWTMAMSELPEKARKVAALRVLGLTAREIEAELGFTTSHVIQNIKAKLLEKGASP